MKKRNYFDKILAEAAEMTDDLEGIAPEEGLGDDLGAGDETDLGGADELGGEEEAAPEFSVSTVADQISAWAEEFGVEREQVHATVLQAIAEEETEEVGEEGGEELGGEEELDLGGEDELEAPEEDELPEEEEEMVESKKPAAKVIAKKAVKK